MPHHSPPAIPPDLLPDPDRLREAIAQHSDRANDLRRLLRLVLKLRRTDQPRPRSEEVQPCAAS
jgi:hypothetical protein